MALFPGDEVSYKTEIAYSEFRGCLKVISYVWEQEVKHKLQPLSENPTSLLPQ